MLATSRKLVILAQNNNKKRLPVLKSSSLQDDKLIINFAWPNIIAVAYDLALITCSVPLHGDLFIGGTPVHFNLQRIMDLASRTFSYLASGP